MFLLTWGSSRSVYSLSLRDAGTGAARSCTFDDHTPSSCLVACPLATMGHRSVNTLVLPDPWLTQEGSVKFQACALYQLFVRSRDLAHHGLYCSQVCACTHHSLLQYLSLVFAFVIFSSQMEEQQNVRVPLGTTEWNHSYYTGNSLSALFSLQQLQAGANPAPPAQMSASTRVSHGAAPSSSVSCPRITLSAAHPRVLMDPTRTFTSEFLSATLAEAATQLSFVAFLERCIFVSTSPPPQLPVPTPSLDVATQTFHHTAASRDVSTHLSFRESLVSPSTLDALCPACARPFPSLLLDAAVQAPLHSVAIYDAST